MFENDQDVTPVNDEGNHLPNQTANLDNDEYSEDKQFVTITEDMLDPKNPELTYNDDDNEIIPASDQQKFAGIPRLIRFKEIFYNPYPQDEWENIRGEAAEW
jgi:hypothetical protein